MSPLYETAVSGKRTPYLEGITMDEVDGVRKKPFLRKGTGLRRFYKDIDIDAHFDSLPLPSPVRNKYDDEPGSEAVTNQVVTIPISSVHPSSSVLKSADSPKRNLNVRFSQAPSVKVIQGSGSSRVLDFKDSTLDKSWRPSFERSGSSGDESSDYDDTLGRSVIEVEEEEDEEWETDSDGEESAVEMNESLVDEVFKSILQAKANGQLGPKAPEQGNHATGQSKLTIDSSRQIALAKNKAPEKREIHLHSSPVPWKLAPGNPTEIERELQMFEKMEQMTSHQSFCSTASTVRRFVNTELRLSPVTVSLADQQPTFAPSSNTNVQSTDTQKFQNLPGYIPQYQNVPNITSHLSNQSKANSNALNSENRMAPPTSSVALAVPPTLNPAIDLRKHELEQDDEYLKALLLTRINQLESEIFQHRAETQRIRDIRASLEIESRGMEESKRNFEQRQSKEQEIIDDLKRRLKRDQEKLSAELKETRKDKVAQEKTESELGVLKVKVVDLEKDIKVRSSRWASSARNFKTTIDELKTENQKLQKTINDLRNDKLKLNQRLRRAGKIPSSDNSQTSDESKGQVQVLSPETTEQSSPTTVSTENSGNKDESGVRRLFSSDGHCLEVHYPNGDIKDLREVDTTGVSKYYFKAADSWEIIHPDGTHTLQFGTGEVQTKLPNGVREIRYASGTVRRVFPDGTEECSYCDGTVVRTSVDGEREIHLPNGQIEHQSKNLKMRLYPDGTEKVLYNDGSSLTSYSSGRQRFRNAAGEVVYDRLPEPETNSNS